MTLLIPAICGCRTDSASNTACEINGGEGICLEFTGHNHPRQVNSDGIRFLNHGALFISSARSDCDGMTGCFTGVTAPALPAERYFCKKINISPSSKMFSYSSSSGSAACFAINQLKPLFEQNKSLFRDKNAFDRFTEYFGCNIGLKANKSYFFFDGVVIAVGSAISCDDSDFEVVTTILQNKLDDETIDRFSCSDPRAMNLFPIDFDSENKMIIVDSRMTGYYIPERKPLKVIRKKFSGATAIPGNRDSFARQDIRTETVYINHGDDPDNDSYAYYIIPNTNLRKMIDFADSQESASPCFRVILKSKTAHVVRNCQSGITAYAVFSDTTGLPGEVYRVSGRAIIFSRTINKSSKLTVRQPGRNTVTITLRGKIELSDRPAELIAVNHQKQPDGTCLTILKLDTVDKTSILKYRRADPPAPYRKP